MIKKISEVPGSVLIQWLPTADLICLHILAYSIAQLFGVIKLSASSLALRKCKYDDVECRTVLVFLLLDICTLSLNYLINGFDICN